MEKGGRRHVNQKKTEYKGSSKLTVAVAGGVNGVGDLLEVKRERLPSLIRVVKPVL